MKRACFFWLFPCLITAFLMSQSSLVPGTNEIKTGQTKQRARVAPSSALSQADPKAQARILDQYGKLPLSFEANHGQTDSRVKFLSRTGGYTLFLTGDEAVLAMNGRKADTNRKVTSFAVAVRSGKSVPGESAPNDDAVLRMKLRNANPAAKVAGVDELPGTNNYFIGKDPAKWRTNVPTYAKVKYKGVYSGIDLVYYGNQRQLEYDFIVAPGANPRRIAFEIRGAKRIRQDAHGELVLKMQTGGDEIRWHKPVVYQEKDGARQEIAARYSITDTNRVGFEVAKYDAGRALYIDPLIYSTYLEGNTYYVDRVGDKGGVGSGIAVDSEGNSYVTGELPYTIFPGTCAGPKRCPIFSYPYVAELNSTGTALVYATFLGAPVAYSGTGNAVAVDSSGNAFVTGSTNSDSFPVTPGAFQAVCDNYCTFVTELNPAGSLVYSTYLGGSIFQGGSNHDSGAGIAVDSSGDAYVTGYTVSTDFPVTAGAYQTTCGNPSSCANAFVTEFNPAGSALLYSTYLGGSNHDSGAGIAVDSWGNVYVTGYATSTDFPVTAGAFQTTCGNPGSCENAFVTEFNPMGSALLYSTYLGGTGNATGAGIGVDSAGNAYVTGKAAAGFPTTPGAFQTTCCGAFVTKFNPTGSALFYSTYLDYASGASIAVDSSGNSYITGVAYDHFPTTKGVFKKTCLCESYGDSFVTKIDPLAATTTALTSSPNPSTDGEAVTFTAAVTSGFGAPQDGEMVSFMKHKTVLGTGVLNGGSASFTTSTLKLGTTMVTAVYGGDSTFAGSTSNAVGQVVDKVEE